jgi:hypothetical protein
MTGPPGCQGRGTFHCFSVTREKKGNEHLIVQRHANLLMGLRTMVPSPDYACQDNLSERLENNDLHTREKHNLRYKLRRSRLARSLTYSQSDQNLT